MARMRRRNHRLDCEALESRRLLSGYYLVNASSGKVLADPGFSTSANAQVDQWQLTGGGNQRWDFIALFNGNYAILNQSSDQALTDYDYSTSNGTPIVQWPWYGGLSQQWHLDELSNGHYAFVNAYSNKVLDDPDFSTGNGVGMIQWQWNGGYDQQWSPLGSGNGAVVTNYLVNGSSGKALEDPNFSTANGTDIIQYQYNGGANQQWTFVPLADGDDVIVNVASGMVLDDPHFSTANGAPVDQWQLNGGTNQQWAVQQSADSNYAIVSAYRDDVLDDPNFSTTNGTDIILWPYNGGTNQEWAFFSPNTGADSSINWSGYVAETNFAGSQTNSVSAVYGSWMVPTVTGPKSSSTHSSVWVGIDGWLGSTVEQIGTEQDVVNGRPEYYAWWEMWSSKGANVPGQKYAARIGRLTIKPGDSISASVQYLTNGPHAGQFDLTLVDSTRNESFSTVVSSAKYQDPHAQRNCAEWTIEAPDFGGRHVLANFGEVTFSDAYATINNVSGPINAPWWQSTALNITGNVTANDTTSVLTDTASSSSSFVVLAEPTPSSEEQARTKAGTATRPGPAVGVTLESGTTTGAPASGGFAGAGTLSPSHYGTVIGQRDRAAQGLSSGRAATDAVLADCDPEGYRLMTGGRRRGRVLGGPAASGE
jgi:hypothetical protein